MTARKKQKNHAPTYCAVVIGLKASEKICTAVFSVLNTIIMLIGMVDVAMDIEEDMVGDMPAIVDDDMSIVAEGDMDMIMVVVFFSKEIMS